MNMTSSQLQTRFGDVLANIPHGPVNVMRHSTRVAVVLTPAQYDALRIAADEGLAHRIQAAEAAGLLSPDESEERFAAHRARAAAMTAERR